jgi:hypothetical protein
MSIERKAETDRDRFEAHYRKVRGDVPSYVFDKGLSNGRYFVLAVQLDWELWQEAIKASGRDELLAALESLLVAVETMKCPQNVDDAAMLVIRFAAPIEHARAAIAKVKGVQ